MRWALHSSSHWCAHIIFRCGLRAFFLLAFVVSRPQRVMCWYSPLEYTVLPSLGSILWYRGSFNTLKCHRYCLLIAKSQFLLPRAISIAWCCINIRNPPISTPKCRRFACIVFSVQQPTRERICPRWKDWNHGKTAFTIYNPVQWLLG